MSVANRIRSYSPTLAGDGWLPADYSFIRLADSLLL